MAKPAETLETDVLVVGSGGAGLVAALSAHAAGARVTVIERSDTVGGTTAVSAGVVWVPNNRYMQTAGIADCREEAIAYITRLCDGRSDVHTIAAFVDTAPAMLDFVEEVTPLKFMLLPHYTDYYAEFPGGKSGGRSLDSGLFNTNELGPWKDRLRKSPIFQAAPMSVTEFFEWNAALEPMNIPFDVVMKRVSDGHVGYGAALVGGLLRAGLDRGIKPLLAIRAQELVVEGGRVVGVLASHENGTRLLRARSGLVLASGGFEWNKDLCAQFLGGVLTHPASPPSNEGDSLRMLMAVGAELGNMSEAWWCPSVAVPGEQYDGVPLYRGEFTMRPLPHTIIVNRSGERFVNEAQNYNDLTKAFFRFDPTYERPNLPAWLVFDSNYAEKYPVLTSMPGSAPPQWIARGATWAELAGPLGIDAEGLGASVARFNSLAADGRDPYFGRGSTLYDRVYGDPRHQPNPCLGSLDKPPFFALPIHPGALGTKGGARVDSHARVLRPNGAPVRGLYAAGNAMAAFCGAGYPGAGATIAAAMTFGFIAGRHAAKYGRETT